MVEKILFIEGTSDDTNGDLRRGFSKLLSQKLKGEMPRIKMGNGVKSTIDKFLHSKSNMNFLLIDLDAEASKKKDKLSEYGLKEHKDYAFFMIQEMEAWFLSQPKILDDFYGKKISDKIPNKKAEEFPKPAEYLMDLTKQSHFRKINKKDTLFS